MWLDGVYANVEYCYGQTCEWYCEHTDWGYSWTDSSSVAWSKKYDPSYEGPNPNENYCHTETDWVGCYPWCGEHSPEFEGHRGTCYYTDCEWTVKIKRTGPEKWQKQILVRLRKVEEGEDDDDWFWSDGTDKWTIDAGKKWTQATTKLYGDGDRFRADLTMEIEGNAFLDEVESKSENKGFKENIIDDINKEAYVGMEVHLYEESGKLVDLTVTDNKGHYKFKNLDPLKKYYVKFVYNGILFRNVEQVSDMEGIKYNSTSTKEPAWNNTSKAAEDGSERKKFNAQFAEIGSYPANYKVNNPVECLKKYLIQDKNGDYWNRVYTSDPEDTDGVEKVFSALSKKVSTIWNGLSDKEKDKITEKELINRACSELLGNNGSDSAAKRLQFVVDLRINAYTNREAIAINKPDNDPSTVKSPNKVYPVYEQFMLNGTYHTEGVDMDAWKADHPRVTLLIGREFTKVGDKTYRTIYEGQRQIHLGLKSRNMFDLGLTKDVVKANLSINGQKETYYYDIMKDWGGFGMMFGVRESDYKNMLSNYQELMRVKYSGRGETLKYEYQEWVPEEDNANQKLLENGYNLYMRREENANGVVADYQAASQDSNYSTHQSVENSYELEKEDRLNINVTYRITIKNLGNTYGKATEVVDYFDKNFTFLKAYIGDAENSTDNRVEVKKTDNSKWSNKFNQNVTDYKADDKYKTVYLDLSDTKILGGTEECYLYVVLALRTKVDDNTVKYSGDILNEKLQEVGQTFETLNVAEINSYASFNNKEGEKTVGLIDWNSIPGNLDLMGIKSLVKDEVDKEIDSFGVSENDAFRAPAMIFSLPESRTLEGTVFEDGTGDLKAISTGVNREGNGTLEDGETGVNGVIVQLIEKVNVYEKDSEGKRIKDENGNYVVKKDENGNEITQDVVRATDVTHNGGEGKGDGWFGFVGFLPGNYYIRFGYGLTRETSMTTESITENNSTMNNLTESTNGMALTSFGTIGTDTFSKKRAVGIANKGLNAHSYNGQDYQSTTFDGNYYNATEEKPYWYTDIDSGVKKSDAQDVKERREAIKNYSRNTNNTSIVNHKAEVFNSYLSEQPEHITRESGLIDKLANELEKETYCYADTPIIVAEVEYATRSKDKIAYQANNGLHEYEIKGIDFGLALRPQSELVLDQDIKSVKLTAADGTVLIDSTVSEDNMQWTFDKDILGKFKSFGQKLFGNGVISKDGDDHYIVYDKKELINLIMDEELISGAKLEVTYNFTLTNNGENDARWMENGAVAKTQAKTIINYVSNNLDFYDGDNKDTQGNSLWKVVGVDEIQKEGYGTYINNSKASSGNLKLIDLSTQQVILQATQTNPLVNKMLSPGESTQTTLKLTKVVNPQSTTDDLTYTNLTEIAEIDNELGRYDHGAVPGNQQLEIQPQEHDTSGASKYDAFIPGDQNDPNNPENNPQDGRIIITPPTGSKHYLVVLPIVATSLLAIGIILIKKFVLDK